MRELEELYQEAQFGTLTDTELEYVAKRIEEFDRKQQDGSQLECLLKIIKEADTRPTPGNHYSKPRAIKYRKLIEPYLDYSRWWMTSTIVFDTLFQPSWGFNKEYEDIILNFLIELCALARYEYLSDEELQYVAEKIREFDPITATENDLILLTLLEVIEECDIHPHPENIYAQPRTIKYRKLIEPFLRYTGWPMIPATVLSTLCQPSWGFVEDYLDIIQAFIEREERKLPGIESPEWDDAKSFAISIAGEYLNKKTDSELTPKDIEMAQSLKSIMDDETDPCAEVAYEAISRAIGVSWEDLMTFPNQNLLDEAK